MKGFLAVLMAFGIAVFAAAREYSAAEQKSFALYFGDLKQGLLKSDLEPDYVDKLMPMIETRFKSEVFSGLTPEQQAEWTAVQNSAECRKFNRDVINGTPDYVAFSLFVKKNYPRLANADAKLMAQVNSIIIASANKLVSDAAAATPLSQIGSIDELKFASEREKDAFMRYGEYFRKGLEKGGVPPEIAALTAAPYLDDFKRDLYDAMSPDIREKWVAFQHSEECTKLNDDLLAGRISTADMLKKYGESQPELMRFDMSHRLTVQKNAVRAQMRIITERNRRRAPESAPAVQP